MPCSDSGSGCDDYGALRARNDELAQMLCILCEAVEMHLQSVHSNQGRGIKLMSWPSAKIYDWWEQHKLDDANRRRQYLAELARQERKRQLLAGLSAEDRQILGV